MLCVLCHNPIIHADKHHWQPICLAYIWLRMVENRVLTLLQVEELVVGPCEACHGEGCFVCHGRGTTP